MAHHLAAQCREYPGRLGADHVDKNEVLLQQPPRNVSAVTVNRGSNESPKPTYPDRTSSLNLPRTRPAPAFKDATECSGCFGSVVYCCAFPVLIPTPQNSF
ncbi:hypothetical protein MRX96_033744 [Rhipicephalus microplus]